MFAPEAWLALLRVVVGSWFVTAVWTKLSLGVPSKKSSVAIDLRSADVRR
jgi:uncharacterized membrane protein YphA (DoxX/SURF4 family)